MKAYGADCVVVVDAETREEAARLLGELIGSTVEGSNGTSFRMFVRGSPEWQVIMEEHGRILPPEEL